MLRQQFSGYKRLLALLMDLKLVPQNISKRYIQYLYIANLDFFPCLRHVAKAKSISKVI
jgi:hypothetical protein